VIALLAAMLLQAQQPQVVASADRGSVSRGDTVVVTIRVTAQGNEPVRIASPDLVGLSLVESRETSRVQMAEGVAQRVTVRVLRLVATTDGRAVVRGIRVTQGSRVTEAPALTVDVAPVAVGLPSLDPSLQKLIDGLAPPASADQVVVSLVPSRTTVVLGDQVDLVTVAWFPRDVRSRLRTVPAFEGPDVQGAWSYQQAGPAGVAASRQVGDRWYDLFLQYQTVFPLQIGPLRVGRASVAYALPLTYSFLSRELRHVVPSDSVVIEVSPYPVTGQPAGFSGAAGGGLALRLAPTEYDMSVGEARTLTVSLEGRGNVALWPEPEVQWPTGLRAYPGDVQVNVTREQGLIRGSKVFTYLLVADSAGSYRVKPPVYPYYDLDQRRYVQIAALPLEIAARPGQGPALRRAEPPPLIRATPPGVPLATRLPWGVWPAVAVAPLFMLGLSRRRRSGPRAPAARATERSELDSLDRRFRRELERLVPRGQLRDGDGLADALRAAGIEAPLASHVARVRDRLRQALYGKEGSTDAQELRAEVQEVLRALLGEGAGASRSGLFTRVAVALLLAAPVAARGQNVSPERLYEAGALRAAADSFAARAAREPEVAAHWYNLGNAWYRQGSDAWAEVAWLRAARLAPRNGLVERAMALVPPPDPFSERLLWVGPVTPDEALSLAAALWLLGSLLLPWRRVRPIAVGALLAALAAAGYGGWTLRRYRMPVAVTLGTETPLRDAPYGSASAGRRVGEGTAVLIQAARPGWYLVSFAGVRGWVLHGEVLRL